MADLETDVKPAEDSSTQAQEVVNDEQTTDQSAQTAEQTVEQPQVQIPPVAGQPTVELDEFGVSWKNRAMENKRKFEEANERINRLEQTQAQGQKQEYTEAELTAFANDPTTPTQNKMWALQEAEKVRTKKLEQTVRSVFEGMNQKQRDEMVKQQTFTAVVSRNPDLVVKDSFGNVVGWNNNSPLAQRINFYMQNPKLQNQPEALEVAEAMAIRDIHYGQTSKLQANQQQLKMQVKNLQKQTLVEGNGKTVPQGSVSPTSKSVQRARETGNIKDASSAMKDIFKASGVLQD
jgi:hypothetical protein